MFVLQRLYASSPHLVSQVQGCCKLHTWLRVCKIRKFPKASAAPELHSTKAVWEEKDLQPSARELVQRERFFQDKEVKTKEGLLRIIAAYNKSDPIKKRGHIEFIYAALNHLSEFGADGDAEVYKRLMDVFPKGKMVAKSILQAEFMHFSRHQECGIYLLDHMEHEGLIPDREMKEMAIAAFGKSSVVYKKLVRMLYWMPKLKNLNPYMLPDPLPTDPRELARLALHKMARDKRTTIDEYETSLLEGASDQTWVLSAQSPAQRQLLSELPDGESLWVEGPSLVWLRKVSMTYFALRAQAKAYPPCEVDEDGTYSLCVDLKWVEGPSLVWLRKVSMTYFALRAQAKAYLPCEVDEDDVAHLSLHMFGEPKQAELALVPQSMHEQEDGLVLALCCTGTSSKDSLLSWVRLLQGSNPRLAHLPVLFKLRTSPKSVSINSGGLQADEETIHEAVRAEREAAQDEETRTNMNLQQGLAALLGADAPRLQPAARPPARPVQAQDVP
ncbi:hypothetical protein JTE90_014951 [Oedothorax gibbosus]|uniref:Evolutionarily conserved signaling intermediate in Toll pathway, mitochondrial n=1 Tax=Oedothorax gibbosus TaxID=931172 RepID=A0AAV6UWN3_9ARAC|nr:hypothetical protein JTE90_014951 [Oedothorax gibbosus]